MRLIKHTQKRSEEDLCWIVTGVLSTNPINQGSELGGKKKKELKRLQLQPYMSKWLTFRANRCRQWCRWPWGTPQRRCTSQRQPWARCCSWPSLPAWSSAASCPEGLQNQWTPGGESTVGVMLSKGLKRRKIKIGSFKCLYTPVSLSMSEMESIICHWGHLFLRMYLRWSLDFMYLVLTRMPGGVTLGDSGLLLCPLSVERC